MNSSPGRLPGNFILFLVNSLCAWNHFMSTILTCSSIHSFITIWNELEKHTLFSHFPLFLSLFLSFDVLFSHIFKPTRMQKRYPFVCLHFHIGLPSSMRFRGFTFTRSFDIDFKSLDSDLDLNLTFAFAIPFHKFLFLRTETSSFSSFVKAGMSCQRVLRVLLMSECSPLQNQKEYHRISFSLQASWFWFRLNGLKNCLTQHYFSYAQVNTRTRRHTVHTYKEYVWSLSASGLSVCLFWENTREEKELPRPASLSFLKEPIILLNLTKKRPYRNKASKGNKMWTW